MTLFTWHAIAGLSLLEHNGDAEVSVSRSGLSNAALAPFFRMRVHDRESGWYGTIHVDLSDGAGLRYPERFGPVDVIFKRTINPDSSNDALGVPVLPYGMIFECRSGNERLSLLVRHGALTLQGLLPPRSLRDAKLIRATIGFSRRVVGGARRGGLPMPLEEFEIAVDEPAEPRILYQTRVWDTGSGHDPTDRDAVNEMRAQVVRALKKEFGEHYLGGLVPSPLALERYPDCVTTLQSTRPSYVELLRRCSIVVSTAGLHRSIPFKLPEYLAASRAVVTQRIETILPSPLVDGEHVLAFTTPEECVERCRELLSDPALRMAIRQRGSDYYRSEVRPDALLLNRLRDLEGIQRTSDT